LGGPFGNVSVTGGAGVAGTLDTFAGGGDGPGGVVTGLGVTLGGGAGLGGAATVTGTTVVPFGHTKCAGGLTK
jgi:hypothetical protein